MSKRRGFEWKARINGAPFRGTSYEYEDSADDLETWDSEDGRFKTRTKGGRQCKLTLTNATYDEDEDLYGDPNSLTVDNDQIFEILLYPAGLLEDPHEFTNMLLMSGKGKGEKKGLQPETFEFASSGVYNLANETITEF